MTKRRCLILSVTLAIAACGDPTPPPGEPGTLVTSLSEIAGPWDIARFGDYEPSRLDGSGIRRAYVNVGRKGLAYTIECNYSGNPAHIDRHGVLHDETKDGSRFTTLASCGPEGDAREGAFYGFFSSRPKVSWLSGGRLRLANGRTVLILERPETRRLANVPTVAELTRPWVPQMATRVDKNGGYSGSGFRQPGLLRIERGRLSYSNCGGITVGFELTKEGRMLTSSDLDEASCGTDSGDRMLLRILNKDPFLERTAGGGIALTAGKDVISLQTEEEARLRGTYPPLPTADRLPAEVQPPPPPR